MRKLPFALLLILFMTQAFAQNKDLLWSPAREVLLLPGTDSLLIDSLPVVRNSIFLRTASNDTIKSGFRVVGTTSSYLLMESPSSDTLILGYEVVQVDLNKTYRHKDTSLIIPEITTFNTQLYTRDQEEFKPFEGLDSKGSISRSISVGNNQDAVLNSSLNLQLGGMIGRNTEIRASITDHSIPAQADGYTQQLREFDRVFIELENPDFGLLRAGDFNMTATENYFLRFDKRISGAGVFSEIPLENGAIPIIAQGGIARGKFARNRFQGQEGNQGPYKLTGPNGERFIIIISGSERVYIDGVLMQRGQQNDYVMDYNAGEIIFTALRPITKESRIVVEFQFTEQSYLRSAVFGGSGYVGERFKANIQFYSEQDSRNQPLTQDLSNEEKQVLAAAGDDLENAVVPTIIPSAFQDDLVLYELTDSLGYDSVLVYSTDSTASLFQASFSYLGPNQGNYVLSPNNANGRVFRWVPPENGIPQGNYEPVKQLTAPNKLQILSVETEAAIGNSQILKVDLAISKNDLNLFSDFDEADDVGSAGRFEYGIKGKLGNAEWTGSLHYEYNQSKFKTVERIRDIEFARNWNLPLNYNDEIQLGSASFGLLYKNTKTNYRLEHLQIDGYSGLRNSLYGSLKNGENIGRLELSWLTTRDSLNSTDFLREKAEFIHYITPGFWTGLRSTGEINQRKARGGDTLNPMSYKFLEYQIFTGIGDTADSYGEIFYLQRVDDTAIDGMFQNFSLVNTYGLRSAVNTDFNSRFEAFINVRNLKVYLPEERDLERTITSRLNYIQRFFGNAITSTTFYETGSGTEPRRSYSYIEVPAGTGVYTHTDYNGNGIKELDEFEVAPTADLARYIRIFTPVNEYLRTNINRFGENININAPNTWQSAEDFRSTLSHFSLLLNYQLDRKTLLTGDENKLNPFRGIEHDTLIVALNNSFRSTVFFNRSSDKFGMDYTYRITDNHNLLSFGIEQRKVEENSANLRYRIFDPLLFRTLGRFLNKRNTSGNFSRRNFSIREFTNEYSLSYQPGDKFQLTGLYNFSLQTGMAEDEIELNRQDLGMELNYSLSEKFSALGRLNYILNNFTGNSNNPAAFEMLQGLRPGKNVTWHINLQQTIRKNILISLNYDGRVSEDGFPINTGSVQVKAFF